MKSFGATIKVLANMWNKLSNKEKSIVAFLIAGNK